jgi:hypothetical protein
VTLVVPFPPGGSTDAIARVLSQKLQEKLGGTFIIDNKPGATGTIGAAFVKRAPGRRLHAVRVLARPVRDRAPPDQGRAVRRAEGLRPDHDRGAGAQRAGRAGELARQDGGRPAGAPEEDPGQGELRLLGQRLVRSPVGRTVLAAERHRRPAHPRTRAAAPPSTTCWAARWTAAFVNINSIIQHIKAGKVRALAISPTSRSPLLPVVATLQEQGVKGAEVQSWQAVAGARRAAGESSRPSLHKPHGGVRSTTPPVEGEAAGARLRDRGHTPGAAREVPGRRNTPAGSSLIETARSPGRIDSATPDAAFAASP